MKKPLTMEEITVPVFVGRHKIVALRATSQTCEQRVTEPLDKSTKTVWVEILPWLNTWYILQYMLYWIQWTFYLMLFWVLNSQMSKPESWLWVLLLASPQSSRGGFFRRLFGPHLDHLRHRKAQSNGAEKRSELKKCRGPNSNNFQ